MKFVHVVKGKLLAVVLAGVVFVGGASAVFASTPVGQNIVHTVTHSQSAKDATGVVSHENHGQDATNHSTSCPGLPETKQLATKFALSTDSASDAIKAICALHQGTFKATTSSGASVSSSRVLGYGEIEMLLTYAQFLAGHDKANTGGKLSSSNVSSFLAQALQSCGTMPFETCLKTNIPGYQPGTGNSGTANTNSQHNDHGHGTGGGKPTSTPTPSPHH
jgi:hypothetical protein